MPQLEEFRKEEEELGFKLLLIDAKGMVRKTMEILDEKEVTIPLLIDSHSYSRNVLKTMYTPTTFIIDADGRLRARLVGGSSEFEDILREVLRKI